MKYPAAAVTLKRVPNPALFLEFTAYHCAEALHSAFGSPSGTMSSLG